MSPIEPVLPARRGWPLFDAATTRAIEQAAMAELPPHTLMQRAGAAVASLARAVAPHARRIWIAVGPGNKGGDGLDAAIRLRAAGADVRVTAVADPATRPADAQDALVRARTAGVPIGPADEAWLGSLGRDDLAIDALLGIGALRPLEGPMASAVRRFSTLRCVRLAVDVPSGLDADTGATMLAAQVHHTLALITLKPGLFTGQGRDAAGRVWLATLGVEAGTHAPCARLVGAEPASMGTARPHASHKGSYGDLAVVGGAPGLTGAALLAARAAQAAGAGRVFVALLDPHPIGLDALHPELMFRPHWPDDEAVENATVVAGCGGGEAVRAVLPRLLSRAHRLVLDADALNAIASDPMLQTLLATRAQRSATTVLTPHPLEAARLLGTDTAAVQADRRRAAGELASRTGSLVVLKGSGSVVATPSGECSINGTGHAALSGAGTGDVLAGWIGGAWAEAGASAAVHESVVRAVALHGLAAEPVRAGPIEASELIDAMRRLRRGTLSAT